MTTTPLTKYVDPNVKVAYNGYTFPPCCRLRITTRPEYDPAARSRIASRYTLEIYFLASNDDAAAQGLGMADIRNRLQTPRGKLEVTGHGYGDIVIDGRKGSQWDLDWGPKPQLLSWVPAGGALAAECVWTCEFSILDCVSSGSVFTLPGVLYHNYEINWTVDIKGLTKRMIAGEYAVPATFGPNPTTLDPSNNAESRWNNIVQFPIPEGFRRTQSDRTVGQNGTVMSYTLTDEQVGMDYGSYYPPGIVDGSFEIEIGNVDAQAMNGRWKISVSCEMERALNMPANHGVATWFRLIVPLIRYIRDTVVFYNDKGEATRRAVFIQNTRMRSDKWTRRDSFSIDIETTCMANQIIPASTLWQPMLENMGNYQNWYDSILVLNPTGRGQAALTSPYNAPVPIGDLCAAGQANTSKESALQSAGGYIPPAGVFDCDVSEGQQYIRYANTVKSTVDKRTSLHEYAEDIGEDNPNQKSEKTKMLVQRFNKPGNVVIQKHAAPVLRYVMSGWAKTLLYEPSIPMLEVDGMKLHEAGRDVEILPAGVDGSNCQVWFAKWKITYEVESYSPGETNLTKNVQGGMPTGEGER